jgi:plasmid maintenance system antidote protein VapI
MSDDRMTSQGLVAERSSPAKDADAACDGARAHDVANPWPPMDADGSHSPLAETIREEMAARGWTVAWVARRLGGIDAVQLELLLAAHHDRMSIDAAMADSLARVFGVSAQFFLNLDAATRAMGYAMAPAPPSAEPEATPQTRRERSPPEAPAKSEASSVGEPAPGAPPKEGT